MTLYWLTGLVGGSPVTVNPSSPAKPLPSGEDGSTFARARPALRHPATETRTGQFQFVAKHEQQRRLRRRGHNLLGAAYGQRKFIRHDFASRAPRFHKSTLADVTAVS
jgi:hypothetical protein